jgi:hypothetical protein
VLISCLAIRCTAGRTMGDNGAFQRYYRLAGPQGMLDLLGQYQTAALRASAGLHT